MDGRVVSSSLSKDGEMIEGTKGECGETRGEVVRRGTGTSMTTETCPWLVVVAPIVPLACDPDSPSNVEDVVWPEMEPARKWRL